MVAERNKGSQVLRNLDRAQLQAWVASAFPITAFNPRPASGPASADSAEFRAIHTARGAALSSSLPIHT